jgi:hypothetical protein
MKSTMPLPPDWLMVASVGSMTVAPPWLTAPFVGGIIAFIGVMFAQLIAILLDRVRSRREDRRRWHMERRQVYARLVASHSLAAKTLFDGWLSDSAWEPSSFAQYDDFMSTRMELNLLASADVREAARELSEILDELCRVRGEADLDARREQMDTIFETSWRCQERFFKVARQELGVTD